MKLKIEYTSKFKKDIKLISKRGKNIQKIFDVIEKLANNELLDFRYQDHQLINFYFNNCKVRECHIEPDWLLIYFIDIKNSILFWLEQGVIETYFKKRLVLVFFLVFLNSNH